MAKRIIWIIAAVIVGVVFYAGYRTFDAGRALSSGDVRRENSNSTESTTPATITTPTPAPSPTIVYPAPNEPGGSGGVNQTEPVGTSGQTPPPGDTLNPNPPEGERFGGSGIYQLYRQGNITYRLNTETGVSCIIFATKEEWAKPLVQKHACPKK
jgi:hypothetical protein